MNVLTDYAKHVKHIPSELVLFDWAFLCQINFC